MHRPESLVHNQQKHEWVSLRGADLNCPTQSPDIMKVFLDALEKLE